MRIWDVNFKHLQAFLAVADTLSFTHAAARLDSNQPTLTRSIRRLEEQLDVPLFHRTTRQVTLSPAGVKLREHLQTLLPHLERALFPLSERPVLRLGFSWLLPDAWMQEAIVRFEEETGAGVELRRRDDRSAGVDQGIVDLALLRGRTPVEGMRATELDTEECVAAVPQGHPWSGRPWADWAELADYPMVINSVSGVVGEHDWPASGKPVLTVQCHNFDECLESVAAGRGISVLPDLVLRRNLHPSVRFVPLRGAPEVPISLVRPAQGAHPLADRFTAVARRVISARRTRRLAPQLSARHHTERELATR
ncbi:LysR family transcriptional regulator [Streptomyces sp. NPDC049585]|uniref:LysR family transcriptional regulator n=1 Tax=Streptomyces sp. NPDC049585 TaxID=3155154 RepID=UPI00343E089C